MLCYASVGSQRVACTPNQGNSSRGVVSGAAIDNCMKLTFTQMD